MSDLLTLNGVNEPTLLVIAVDEQFARYRPVREGNDTRIISSRGAEEEAFAIVAALAGTRAPDHNSAHRAAVERAKAFLGRHFREPVSLGEVARAVGASPFSLSRAFSAVTGTTLHRYLVSLRLAWTLDAIAAGADDLSAVASDAGFAHRSHFSKTFARAFGATPRALRRQLNPVLRVKPSKPRNPIAADEP